MATLSRIYHRLGLAVLALCLLSTGCGEPTDTAGSGDPATEASDPPDAGPADPGARVIPDIANLDSDGDANTDANTDADPPEIESPVDTTDPADTEPPVDDVEPAPDATEPGDEDTAAPPALYCEPNGTRCLGDLISQTCDESGGFWKDAICEEGEKCYEGSCDPVVCIPGEAGDLCVTANGPGVCNEVGTGYVPDPCPDGLTCFEGACVGWVCTPFEAQCWSMTAVQTCKDDGTAFEVTELCEPGGMCQGGGCVSACEVAAMAGRTIGCEFLTVGLDAAAGDGTGPGSAVIVSVPADSKDVLVMLQDAGSGEPLLEGPVGVDAGTWKVIPLPTNNQVDGSHIGKNAYRIVSDGPITAQQIAPWSGDPDAVLAEGAEAPPLAQGSSLLLPVENYGEEHLIPSWPSQSVQGEIRRGYLVVAAAEDDTEIDVFSRADVAASPPGGGVISASAGQLLTFELSAGQTLQIATKAVEGQDQSGTRIRSSKPVAVFSGHECARIPTPTSHCNHIQEQIPPVRAWGKTVIATPFAPRSDTQFDLWRVTAGAEGTTVTTDPPQSSYGSSVLARGASIVFHSSEPFVVDADAPILVTRMLTGARYPGHTQACDGDGPGDPELTVLSPVEQHTERAVVAPVPGFETRYLEIVVPAPAIVWIGEAPLAAEAEAVGSSGWVVYRIPFPLGSPTITSDHGMALTTYGYACGASYASPAGGSLTDLTVSVEVPALSPPPPPEKTSNGFALDEDDDEVLDDVDNCPGKANPDQKDLDGDGHGDVCDLDIDGDGALNTVDCAPADASASPFVVEKCDGVDNDCDTLIDEAGAADCLDYFVDQDGDGAGAAGFPECLCAPAGQYVVPFGGDCHDGNELISPWVIEKCDDLDNDCNGLIDDGCDDDGDGWCDDALPIVGAPAICTNGAGDCQDYSALVSPALEEVPGNKIDDDCDGLADNEVLESDCTGIPCTGDSLQSLICATELCFGPDTLVSVEITSPTESNTKGMFAAVAHLGSPANDLAPMAGPSYLVIETGDVASTSNDKVVGGSPVEDPFPKFPHKSHDAIEIVVTMKAPEASTGFRIDSLFLSAEYEEKIGKAGTDKFYLILNAPTSTGGEPKVINYGPCVSPELYFDAAVASAPVCFIGVNSNWGESCANPATNIAGTGFECGPDGPAGGSTTGWLRTWHAVEGGEKFTLTFHIHDTNNGSIDSAAIIDNFVWESGVVVSGTIKLDPLAP